MADSYKIRKLRFEVVPGLWMGALLYEPVGISRKMPAVLNTNGHDAEHGMFADYKQIRCINLAKRGIFALNVEFLGFGQLSDSTYWHSNIAILDLCGVSGLSPFYLVLKRGLDVLCSLEMVDQERLAVTGLSGGGWQTIIISALDTRVKLSVPNAGYMGIADRFASPDDLGDLEQAPSDFTTAGDYVHLTALLAPRLAMLIYNAEDDCCFRADRAVPSVYEPVVPLYELYQKSENFALYINTDPGTHNYFKDNRQAFYRFINEHFLPENERIDEEIDVESEILGRDKLEISFPSHNENFSTLATSIMDTLPQNPYPNGTKEENDKWREDTRRMLKEVVRPDLNLTVDSVKALPDLIAETGWMAQKINIGEAWTLPLLQYMPKAPTNEITLIMADEGFTSVRDVINEVCTRNDLICVVDILLTGECRLENDPGLYAQVIATVGRRPLGVQVSQLSAIIDFLSHHHSGHRFNIITNGRVSGLAALVTAAIQPNLIKSLELRSMDSSMKHFISQDILYTNAKSMYVFRYPSLFCFGLLELVDIPELIALAAPVAVTFR